MKQRLRSVTFYGGGGSSEEWFIEVLPDGRVYKVVENDGWAYSRKGPETSKEPITMRDVRRRYPSMLRRVQKAQLQFFLGIQPRAK